MCSSNKNDIKLVYNPENIEERIKVSINELKG